MWKTYEGEVGVTRNGSYLGSWCFSLDPNSPNRGRLLETINKAIDSGAKVKIHYIEHNGSPPWKGKTTYQVDKIEFLSKKSASAAEQASE